MLLRAYVETSVAGTALMGFVHHLHSQPRHDRWDVVIPLEMLVTHQVFYGRQFTKKKWFSNAVIYFLAYITNVHTPVAADKRQEIEESLKILGWHNHVATVYESYLDAPCPLHLTGYKRTFVCTRHGENPDKYSRRHQVGRLSGYHVIFAAWIFWQHVVRR